MLFSDHGIIGFDVSYYQDDNNTPQKIDFRKMKLYGASFVIVKAGQLNYQDQDFRDYWRDAKAAGIPRGSYWFGDKGLSGKAQALTYWNLIKDDIGEGLCCIDYEDRSWTDWRQLKDFLVEFMRLSQLPPERIAVYTAYYYWNEHSPILSTDRQWFAQFPLWLAWYAPDPQFVRVPTPWTEALIWQAGTPSIGLAVGVESLEVDYNKFNGDATKFAKYFGASPVTSPVGGIMKVGTVTVTKLNIRTGPSVSHEDIGDLFLHDKVYGELDITNNWLHFNRIQRVDGTQQNMDGWASADYMSLADIPTPPPTTGLPATLWIGTTKDNVQEYVKK